MQNTILEMIMDEIHESTNGHLQLLKVLETKTIIVHVDNKLFLTIHEILAPLEKLVNSSISGDLEKLLLLPETIYVKYHDRAQVKFIRKDYLIEDFRFKITPE